MCVFYPAKIRSIHLDVSRGLSTCLSLWPLRDSYHHITFTSTFSISVSPHSAQPVCCVLFAQPVSCFGVVCDWQDCVAWQAVLPYHTSFTRFHLFCIFIELNLCWIVMLWSLLAWHIFVFYKAFPLQKVHIKIVNRCPIALCPFSSLGMSKHFDWRPHHFSDTLLGARRKRIDFPFKLE